MLYLVYLLYKCPYPALLEILIIDLFDYIKQRGSALIPAPFLFLDSLHLSHCPSNFCYFQYA